jgi:hypothetical protein
VSNKTVLKCASKTGAERFVMSEAIKKMKELGKLVEAERTSREEAMEAKDSLYSMAEEYEWAVRTCKDLETDPNANVECPYFGGIYRGEEREETIAHLKKVLVIFPKKRVEMEDLVEKTVKNWETAFEALAKFRDTIHLKQGDG